MSFLEHPALAPIRSLLLDPQVTEIMINGPSAAYVERDGLMAPCKLAIKDEAQLMLLIDALLKTSGREVSTANPYADFRLSDGSRGNVILPPLALNGPVVTLRKFTKHVHTLADLVRLGTLSRRMGDLLAAAVKARANILFSGATGTGKTTTLSVLSGFIPAAERIITIEDTAEVQLQQDHVVRLECRQPNAEGKGAVTLADLLRNSFRMRPTRIIVGEIRGDEAIDMLQAIASGHAGCLAVMHAGSPLDAVGRLELMSLSRGLLLPLWAIHRQLASAIDLIVQQDQLADGVRKITRITELTGVEGNQIVLRDLFAYERKKTDSIGREVGHWACGGFEPRFLVKCRQMGVELPAAVYAEGIDNVQ